METYQTILERLLVIRNAPWRNDPEREQAMREATTQAVVDLLQKLHFQFDNKD